MNEKEIVICVLCFETISDNPVEIGEQIKVMIKALQINLNCAIIKNPNICQSCFDNVKKFYDKKMALLKTEDITTTSVGLIKDIVSMDLEEIDTNLTGMLIDDENVLKLCRFCSEIVQSNYTPLEEVEEDLLKKCIPEMDLGLLNESVVCTACLDNFQSQYAFINNCLQTLSKIEKCCQQTQTEEPLGPCDIVRLEIKSENATPIREIDTESGSVEVETGDMETDILKQENLILADENDASEAKQTIITEIKRIKRESSPHHNTSKFKNKRSVTKNRKETLKRKPQKLEIVHCDKCSYKTADKKVLTKHSIVHKNLNEAALYSCTCCAFKTKHKHSLTRHMHTHQKRQDYLSVKIKVTIKKKSEEMVKLKCSKCPYMTWHENRLKIHLRKHKKEEKQPSCSKCPYTGRHSGSFSKHLVIHMKKEEATLHKCDQCSFASNSKNTLDAHVLKHKNSQDVKMYSCDICRYQSKYKGNLKKHLLVHMSNPLDHLAENKEGPGFTYRCTECGFVTGRKTTLARHVHQHSAKEAPKKYKCDKCAYRCRFKGNLKKHTLVHLGKDETPQFKCQHCSFSSKYKNTLEAHLLLHKEQGEVQMFRCKLCPYKSFYKGNLKAHMIVHLNSAKGGLLTMS